jgi:hypothetical protein
MQQRGKEIGRWAEDAFGAYLLIDSMNIKVNTENFLL